MTTRSVICTHPKAKVDAKVSFLEGGDEVHEVREYVTLEE